TEAAAGRVDAALRAAGLAPGQVSANGLVIPVATTVGRASAGLHTRFERYKLGSGRLALANTSAPRLSATVAPLIQAIDRAGQPDHCPVRPADAVESAHPWGRRPVSRATARAAAACRTAAHRPGHR